MGRTTLLINEVMRSLAIVDFCWQAMERNGAYSRAESLNFFQYLSFVGFLPSVAEMNWWPMSECPFMYSLFLRYASCIWCHLFDEFLQGVIPYFSLCKSLGVLQNLTTLISILSRWSVEYVYWRLYFLLTCISLNPRCYLSSPDLVEVRKKNRLYSAKLHDKMFNLVKAIINQ